MKVDLKTRLAVAHAVAAAAILAVAVAGAHWTLRRAVLGQVIDRALLVLAEAEGASLSSDVTVPIRVHEMNPGSAPPSFDRLDKFVQIVDMSGRVLARSSTLGTSQLPAPPAFLARLKADSLVFQTRSDFGAEPIRIVTIPVERAGTRYAVQVAMSLDDAYTVLDSARWILLLMSVAIVQGVGVIGVILARRALVPIDRIVARARHIGESSLGDRLPHPGMENEIGRLVDTLNEMLGRIERSFEVQRRFTADASHELRSPLSRLRAELEVTLRRPRDRPEYEDTLRSALEEVEHLSRLTEELLVLARLDSDRRVAAGASTVVVGDSLREAVARLADQARDRAVSIRVLPAPVLSCGMRLEPAAAGLVFTNLVDNAVKFSPRGGVVTVDAQESDGDVVIAVSDAGPGIPAEEVPRLFERFYRGSAARFADGHGAGLGLAICRTILERHGGRISVESEPGKGATFRVRLPIG